MKLSRYLFSELSHNKKFVFFFIFNLCVGLSGFIALDGFKSSVESKMQDQSKAVLGADLSLSARRPLSDEEVSFVKNQLPSTSEQATVTELYSMVTMPDQVVRLVKIKAVSDNYPFYGDLTSESGESMRTPDLFAEKPRVWVFSELVSQANLSKGSRLKIGNIDAEVSDIVVNDSTTGLGASFAPTIYMSIETLVKTQLVREGSVAWHSRLYQVPIEDLSDLRELKDDIFENLPLPDARLQTHADASEQMSRLLQNLNDYLGLAAVVALFLAAVGTGFLYRSYFQRKLREIAILISLGQTKNQAAFFYLMQILLLGFLSAGVALMFSYLLVPVLQSMTTQFLPFDFEYVLGMKTISISLLVGTLGSFFICLPFLAQIRDLQPKILLSEGLQQFQMSTSRFVAYCLPGILFFWGLSVWQANSFYTASIFLAAFFAAGVLFIGISLAALQILERLKIGPQMLSLQWAIRDMSRERLATVSCFLCLGLGAVLLNLIPQVQASLDQELSAPETSKIPSLFMFDIQEEQLSDVEKVFFDANVPLTQVSPMIRSRLITVNGEDFEKGKGAGEGVSREEEREMRFRNRGFNLSYREKLSDSEKIFDGEPVVGSFDSEKDEVAKISVEKRFADRLGLNIGDRLKFEIESVPVEGIVYNLRTVKWTSFQPNFFLQFQPGVLEMAPKTFIATAASVDEGLKAELQRQLVQVAPNVSIIDVSRLVEKLTEIIGQMSLALQAMAILCLFSGFVVIFSILSHQMESKRWQIGLQKVLGASFYTIRKQVYLHYLLVAAGAAIIGVAVSVVFSFFLSRLLFESVWVFSFKEPLLSIVFILLITLGVVFFASRRYLNQPAKSLIQ